MTTTTIKTSTSTFVEKLKSRIVMIGKHRTSKSFAPTRLIPLWFGGGTMTVLIPLIIFTTSRIINRDNNNENSNNNGNEDNNDQTTPWWFMDFLNSDDRHDQQNQTPSMLVATYLWSLLVFGSLLWYGYQSIRKNVRSTTATVATTATPTTTTNATSTSSTKDNEEFVIKEPSISFSAPPYATAISINDNYMNHNDHIIDEQNEQTDDDNYHGIIVALILFTNYSILSMFLFASIEGSIQIDGIELEQYGFCGQFGILMYITSIFWIIFSILFVLLFRRYQKLKNVTFIDIEPSDYRIHNNKDENKMNNNNNINHHINNDDEFQYEEVYGYNCSV